MVPRALRQEVIDEWEKFSEYECQSFENEESDDNKWCEENSKVTNSKNFI